jgi:hypothetical protein
MNNWYGNNSIDIDLSHGDQWTRKDEDLLLRRLGHADLVAVGTIRLVTHFSRYNTPRNMSLSFKPEEVLHGSLKGDLDQEQLLVMHISPNTHSFDIAKKIQDHPTKVHYLVLIKRKPLSNGQHQLRWVIYQPSREIMARVRFLFSQLSRA